DHRLLAIDDRRDRGQLRADRPDRGLRLLRAFFFRALAFLAPALRLIPAVTLVLLFRSVRAGRGGLKGEPSPAFANTRPLRGCKVVEVASCRPEPVYAPPKSTRTALDVGFTYTRPLAKTRLWTPLESLLSAPFGFPIA